MAAMAAQERGARTLLIEKGHKLGRKLAISGGGRCNVTNAKALPDLMLNIPGNSRFLYSALTRFGSREIAALFESLGIALKEEDHGRIFPVTDKAATVVEALIGKLSSLHIEIWQDSSVRQILMSAGAVSGVEIDNGQRVGAQAIVVATGGCSVPQTGSTGDGYPWAQAAGHQIVDPYPTAVPLTSDAPYIRDRSLQGLSFREVPVQILGRSGKILTTELGDLLFSHFGMSGPVALRCSHYVSTAKRQDPTAALYARIDFLPEIPESEIRQAFESARKASGRRHVRTVVQPWVPDRLADVIFSQAGVSGATEVAQLSKAAQRKVEAQLKTFTVPISGTLPLEKATVTGGGVSVKEISPRTMESKVCHGLFFAGEVMDVHAHTGGYNITVAFSTGHLAGSSAADYVQARLEESASQS